MAKKRANGEGNIRKRKDGRWEGRYTAGYDLTTGKRIIKNVLGKTQAEVKEKLASVKIWTYPAPMTTRLAPGWRTGIPSTPSPTCGFLPLNTTAETLNSM